VIWVATCSTVKRQKAEYQTIFTILSRLHESLNLPGASFLSPIEFLARLGRFIDHILGAKPIEWIFGLTVELLEG
jgi:hypothetical protein